MNDNRLIYDSCSYTEKLNRSIAPGLYSLNTPYDDCKSGEQFMPDDPYIRYQNYGPNTCTMKKAIDDNSELLGLNYKNSKCNTDAYTPGKYKSNGCEVRTVDKPYIRPTENCRLSNPPCTLRSTGINRWEWLCVNPQDRAIEEFNRNVDVKNLFKDNHVPLIEKMADESAFQPIASQTINENGLNNWSQINKQNKDYAPGYPYGTDDNSQLLNCNTNLTENFLNKRR